MITSIRKAATGLFLTGMVFFAGGANATLILDVGPGGDSTPCSACGNTNGDTFGWLFEVTETISVDGIGVWDAGADGIGTSAQVGLWAGGGGLLASATVSDASSPIASAGAGEWLFEDFAAILLTPGRYVLGSVFFSNIPLAQLNTVFTTVPQINFLEGRQGPFDGGLQRPDDNFSDGIFGPTLRISIRTEVPLPSTLVLFLLGLAVFVLRRKPVNSF